MTKNQPIEKVDEYADRVAALCQDLLDPTCDHSYKALGRKHSFSDKTAKALHMRLMTHYMPQNRELRTLTATKMLAKTEDRLDAILDHMTDYKLAHSSAKDLAICYGILAEKRALLRGEPTQIMSIDDSRSLSHLMKDVIAEAERRGLDINSPVLEGEFADLTEANVGTRKTEYYGAKGGYRKSKRNKSTPRIG